MSAKSKKAMVKSHSLFTDFDIDLFRSGKHYRLYQKLGSHLLDVDNESGVYFAVWAPNAAKVGVAGSFNFYNAQEHQLMPRWDESGIWEGFIPGVEKGAPISMRSSAMMGKDWKRETHLRFNGRCHQKPLR